MKKAIAIRSVDESVTAVLQVAMLFSYCLLLSGCLIGGPVVEGYVVDIKNNEALVTEYAPWQTVESSGPDGRYRMSLFLGDRGVLLQPDGTVGPFDFEHPK